MIDLQDVKIKNSSDWDSVCPFPVGFIYHSRSAKSPSSLYGGQWTPLTDGKFLRPHDGWNTQGGAATFSLTLPFIRTISDEVGTSTGQHIGLVSDYDIGSIQAAGRAVIGSGTNIKDQQRTIETLPPYRSCYIWYRTA